ncbi:MAG: response regulator [Planctomycetia bacterium]|nr:response regulator [Planctomycetia bacterium]
MDHILVVDDSRVERCSAGTLLMQRSDTRITFAANGKEALRKIRDSQPHLVVTDLVMPEMDGLELVRAVRKEFPRVPVILMTAYGNEWLAVEALDQGAASYVPKAMQAERLVETADRVIARTRAHRNRQRLTECVGKIEATFYLSNDPTIIPPLVDYVQQAVAGLELGDETERVRAGIALEEAIINAMYYGNLELTAKELASARTSGNGDLQKLVERQSSKARFRDRKIIVEVHITSHTARFVVRDAGRGFDVAAASRGTLSDRFEAGRCRGLTLMQSRMDQVKYNEAGNEVTLIKLRNSPETASPKSAVRR